MINLNQGYNLKKVDLIEFKKLYDAELVNVLRYLTPEMQNVISKHNYGWRSGELDFAIYLKASVKRFYVAYENICESQAASVCDVGGFWGIFPIVLSRLGVKCVAMTEALKYYDSAFDGLFNYIRSKGVEIIDIDPFLPNHNVLPTFDFVSALAVIEHYPHSLRIFMDNFKKFMNQNGIGYIEVPNIAYLPKRVALLRGDTPLSSLRHIYLSQIPFTGHHHEFTSHELDELAYLCDLQVVSKNFYNYSVPNGLYYKFRFPILTIFCALNKNFRECIAVVMKRRKRLHREFICKNLLLT